MMGQRIRQHVTAAVICMTVRNETVWGEWLAGCGAHCMACTAVGTSVTCTAGMCESGYALNAEAVDINSACTGKMQIRPATHAFSASLLQLCF